MSPIFGQKQERLESYCNAFKGRNQYGADSLRYIAEELLNYSGNLESRYSAYGIYAKSEMLFEEQQFKSALPLYEEALKGFIKIEDTLATAVCYKAIGVVNFILGNDDVACDAYLKGFNLFSRLDNRLGMAQMYHNMALIYWRAQNYEKSDYYGLRAIEIYKQIGEKRNLADMFNNYAVSLIRRKEYDKGYEYYQEAIDQYKELKDIRGESSVLFNVGTLFEYKGLIDSAQIYYVRAHSLFENQHDTLNLINSLQKMAFLDRRLGLYRSSLEHLLEAKRMNLNIGDVTFDALISKDLSETFEKLGDLSLALNYYKVYKQLDDSISREESQLKIAEIESKFLVDQTKQELLLSQQSDRIKNYIIVSIILLSVLLFSTLLFYWRNFKIKEEQRILMLEHKVLRIQMDPHFIFNSLSALQCYIMDQKPEEAIRFINDFSALLRLVLQYSKLEYVPISKEKKILDCYLSLQNKRFDNQIKFHINVDEELMAQDVRIPPMLAQPFVENSLEHGGLDCVEDPQITIDFKKKGDFILLSVVDNGIGIEKSLLQPREKEHKSMAISLTHERLKLLNGNRSVKVNLDISDLSHKGLRGTLVEFFIPILGDKV